MIIYHINMCLVTLILNNHSFTLLGSSKKETGKIYSNCKIMSVCVG